MGVTKKKKAVVATQNENSPEIGMAIKIQMCKTEVAKINDTINKAKQKEAEMKVILDKHDAICIKKR